MQPQQERKDNPEEVILDKNNPDSIYNWVAIKVSGPSFRNIIKDFIDDNCSLFIDIEENTFEQGQIFNEFNQLLENILNDVLEEGGLSQDQFLAAAQRGLEDPKYRKYFDQLLNFGDYNFFKRCMTKRNYTLIKRFEEQISQQKKSEEENKQKEEEEKRLIEEEKLKELEKEKEKEKEDNKDNGETKKGEKKEKTEKELEEERQRMLLYQLLNQEEEKELQEVIKESLQMEEEKRRIAVIEEEELNRAIKKSLQESQKPKKEEHKKEEPKKEEPKKPLFAIHKNDNFNIENLEKEKEKEEKKPVLPPKKQNEFSIINNDLFQYSGSLPKEEKPDNPVNIISANKGFEFQIDSNKNNFGIESQNPINISENKKENLIDDDNKEKLKEKKDKIDPKYKDILIEQNKKPEYDKVEIKRRREEIPEKKPIIIDDNKNKGNINDIIKPKIEESVKDDLIITSEIKTKPQQTNIVPKEEPKEQKASDIIKQSLNDNKNENIINDNNEENNNNGGYDRLLISDDDEEEEKPKEILEQKPLTNAFIDKKKDINLGKVKVNKDGGNFLNNFSGMKSYEKGGITKLETKIKEDHLKAVVSNQDEDDDYLAKLKEVEKEKNQKLKEYREKLTKMQKEKRENKAKQTLSPEELAKLQRREQLAAKLKAKRMENN